jgi:hypothetical protein
LVARRVATAKTDDARAIGLGFLGPSDVQKPPSRAAGLFIAQARERSITESITAVGYVFYAWPRQVADFYDMRVRKNFEFGQRFAGVGGMADLVGLQREYVRDTLLDYASSVYEGGGLRHLGSHHR